MTETRASTESPAGYMETEGLATPAECETPTLQYRDNEDALVMPASAANARTEADDAYARTIARWKAGERVSDDEAWHVFRTDGFKDFKRVCAEIDKDKTLKRAVRTLAMQLVIITALHRNTAYLRRMEHEDRIADLERRLAERDDGKRLIAGRLRVVGGRKP